MTGLWFAGDLGSTRRRTLRVVVNVYFPVRTLILADGVAETIPMNSEDYLLLQRRLHVARIPTMGAAKNGVPSTAARNPKGNHSAPTDCQCIFSTSSFAQGGEYGQLRGLR